MIITITTVSELDSLGWCDVDDDGDAKIKILHGLPKSVYNYILTHELQHARDGFNMSKWKSELRAHWFAAVQHPIGLLRGFFIWLKREE